MVDVFKVADVFVDHAIKTHGDEVGIIAYYGSYALGMASPTSDLDLIYIPDDGKATTLAACFILDDICFDFFPISWVRAEGFATGRTGWAVGPALIANAQVLYARSEADLARFNALKAKIVELQRPEQKPQMVQRALETFKTTVFHLGNLRLATLQADFSSIRRAAWLVVMNAVECLALVNQTYFQRGWDANLAEILQLKIKPEKLETLLFTLATVTEPHRINQAAEMLVQATREILLEEQRALATPSTVQAHFANYYPELHDKLNKIQTRCAADQSVGASWAAMFIQAEVALFMAQALSGVNYGDFNVYSEYADPYRQVGLPDLMALDGESLTAQAKQFDQKVQAWLHQQAVPLNRLASLEELAQFLVASDRMCDESSHSTISLA
ncbi:MAG: nucleotidyltransferase domain-containing protein [Caldilineaceae bacterium]